MDATIWTGVFALAGVLVTGILGLVGYRIKTAADLEREFRAKHFSLRLEVYGKAYDFVWSLYQPDSSPQDPAEIVRQAREISRGLVLVGSPAVVRAFWQISDRSSEKLRAAGMREDQILAVQTEAARELFLAIRKDLYPHLEGLRADDIRFVVPKQSPVQPPS